MILRIYLLVEGVIDRTVATIATKKKQKMMALDKQYHDELKLELQGAQYPLAISKVDKQLSDEDYFDLPDYQQIAEDNANLSMVLMPRKKRGLYKAMKICQRRNKDRNKLLEDRKSKLEESHKS
ncbi:pescadillo homolog isoform X1 [Benincasa hispida]|uniref:pescadillo homolog isoform X1 n=1 Tax=Benincasa hispida TaxID=102211 RepID=UPI00190243E5|nr:pescadillo homolog isoform X1 [Benincasa hispida]